MDSLTRREFLKSGGAAALSWSSLVWAASVLGKPFDSRLLMSEALDVYKRAIVVDMISTELLDEKGKASIRDSGVTCMSPSIGTRFPSDPKGTYMLQAFPFQATVRDCAQWEEAIQKNNDLLLPCLKSADVEQAKKEGKTAVMLNIQNAPIEDNLENLDLFHSLGIRSMQLTYNERNLLGDGCTERTNAGLSDFGIAAVSRMNELGILVDTSHSGYQTTMDAIEFSKKPPIFSHTNCYTLNPHPRNKTDAQIKALADKGGVLGLTTVNILVKRDMPVTIEDFLDHIDYTVKLVGIDHVACGSDGTMRGWPTDPAYEKVIMSTYSPERFKPSYRFRYPLATEGMNDPKKWLNVTAGMIRRGYREEDIVKFLGGNWLRLFQEVIG
jgi:membrane dipeptidase